MSTMHNGLQAQGCAPEGEHAKGVPACHAEAINDQSLGGVSLRQDQGASLAEPGACIIGVLQLRNPCVSQLTGSARLLCMPIMGLASHLDCPECVQHLQHCLEKPCIMQAPPSLVWASLASCSFVTPA